MAIIVIDFDGTIVRDKYPFIGEVYHNAPQVIARLRLKGHKVIINTCRSGRFEEEAKIVLQRAGIAYDAINENLPEVIEQYHSDTRKISGDVYIDDKNLGGHRLTWLDIEELLKLEHNIG